MLFGLIRDTKATVRETPPEHPSNDAETLPAGVGKLALVQPSVRELLAAVHTLSDDLKWLQERFDKLQARVTTELREIRREVDRFYDEEPSE